MVLLFKIKLIIRVGEKKDNPNETRYFPVEAIHLKKMSSVWAATNLTGFKYMIYMKFVLTNWKPALKYGAFSLVKT